MPTEIPAGGIDGKVVVLVDDVLFSGRTIRAALDALNDIGRPAGGPARGPRRPRPPRAADPRRLRRQEPAHLAGRAGRRSASSEIDDGRRRDHPGVAGRQPMKRHLLSAADLTRDDAAAGPRHRRGAALAGRPADQEAARPCAAAPSSTSSSRTPPAPGSRSRRRPSGSQRRRHQLLGQGLQRLQGREPQGHRADPRGDGRRRGRRPAPAPAARRTGWRTPAGSRSQRRQRRRRHPRAPHPGAARRVHDAAPPRRAGGGGLDGRRVTIVGDVLHSRVARSNALLLQHARRRGHPGRAADAAAGRRRDAGRSRRRTTSTRCCPRPTR